MPSDLLLRPGPAFRVLARQRGAEGSVVRGPLRLLLFFGAAVSLMASGTLNVRLLVDGAISFAFVPAIQLAALAVVWKVGRRPTRPFASVVDLFFAGHAPWLMWLVAVAAICALVPPRELSPWVWPLVLGNAVPIAWSVWMDFNFFREVAERPVREAVFDLTLHRAIAWTLTLLYFFGIALRPEIPWLASKLGF